MKHIILIALLAAGLPAAGQGVNDLLEGKLLNPKVGQWAWYDLTGASETDKFMVRQAVVGEEKVEGKTGYWLELEIVPAVGFRTVYKMLVTGPASDPKNVHKILLRQEPDGPLEVAVDDALGEAAAPDKAERQSLGADTVKTEDGPVEAERFRVTTDEGKLEIWTSDKVPPMGIVRISSEEGEMVLRGFGEGGTSGASAIDAKSETLPPKVTVKTGKKTGAEPVEAEKGKTP